MAHDPLLTRRALTAGGAALAAMAAARPGWAQAPRTVGEVAARIEAAFGAGWQGGRGDGLAAGDPATRVTGVAVAVSPTLAALRDAKARGLNLVVSIEAPFYSRPYVAPAEPTPFSAQAARTAQLLATDPVTVGKRSFIETNGLAVFRLNDSLRARTPEPLTDALGRALGWRADAADPRIHTLPEAPLRRVIAQVRRVLGVEGGLRTIGDPDMPIRRVLLAPGTVEAVSTVKAMPGVDALLAGDLREWELVEYIADSADAGHPKALIATGRILSEAPGLAQTAAWLRGPLSGLRIESLAVRDPYWRLPA